MQDVFYDDYAEDDSPKGLRRVFAFYLKWGGAVISLAILALIIVWAYRLGVRDAREVPVIKAMDGPMRVLPEDPGGTRVANQGLEVNEILAGNSARQPSETRRAPATLSLKPQDTPAETAEAKAAAAREQAPQPDAAPAPDTTAEAAPNSLDDAVEQAFNDTGGLTVLRPRMRPSRLSAPDTAAPDTATNEAEDEPVPVVTASRSAIDPDSLAAGTRLVQLGAFDSADIAELQWSRLLNGHSDLLGSKDHYVQRAESNGRIFYRLRVVGFDDRNAQRAICEALRARSVDCIPVTVR